MQKIEDKYHTNKPENQSDVATGWDQPKSNLRRGPVTSLAPLPLNAHDLSHEHP